MLKKIVLILFISYCANAVVTVKQAQWAFANILDKDQNNIVDAADLCAVANNLDEISCDSITEQSAKFIAKFDKDNSNTVDEEEFVNVYARIGNIGNPVEPGIQQVHLSLTTDPTEMVVMWVTKDQVGTVVRYGTQPGKYISSTTGNITTYNVGVGGWHGWIHTVVLTELTPGQTYFYQAGVEGYYWSQEYYFTCAPPLYTTSNYTWAVMGDMGTVNPMGWAVTDQMINDNSNDPFNMVLLVGDIAYAGTGSTWEFEEIWDIWEDQVEPLAAICPWMFSVGNHEKYYNFTAYNTRFLMPGPQSGGYHNFWYSITYGDVHWTMISTEHDYSPSSPQYAWLMKDLEAAAANPKIHWIIMNGHRPMYCSNTNEWDNEHEGSDFQKWIEPLMLKYNVDLYLSGHQHMYERVYPVINGTVIMKGNAYVDPHAPVHIVQGTGGANASADDIIPQPVWSAVRNDLWGYGRMTTTANQLYYEFLNLETYKVVDTFSITKTQ